MTLKLVADAADITAGVLVIGTLTKWLPPIAAAFAILWTVIRIFEWARVALWGKPKRSWPPGVRRGGLHNDPSGAVF